MTTTTTGNHHASRLLGRIFRDDPITFGDAAWIIRDWVRNRLRDSLPGARRRQLRAELNGLCAEIVTVQERVKAIFLVMEMVAEHVGDPMTADLAMVLAGKELPPHREAWYAEQVRTRGLDKA